MVKKNYDENNGKQFQSPSAFSSEKSEGLRNLFSLLWLITGPPMIIISLSIISASSLLWRPIPVCVFERRHIGHQIVPISYLRLAGNSRWSGYDHAMLKNTMINTISNIINVIRTQFCWKRHGIHHFAFVLHVILCKDRSELFLQDPFIGNVFAMSNAWHFQSIESPHVSTCPDHIPGCLDVLRLQRTGHKSHRTICRTSGNETQSNLTRRCAIQRWGE